MSRSRGRRPWIRGYCVWSFPCRCGRRPIPHSRCGRAFASDGSPGVSAPDVIPHIGRASERGTARRSTAISSTGDTSPLQPSFLRAVRRLGAGPETSDQTTPMGARRQVFCFVMNGISRCVPSSRPRREVDAAPTGSSTRRLSGESNTLQHRLGSCRYPGTEPAFGFRRPPPCLRVPRHPPGGRSRTANAPGWPNSFFGHIPFGRRCTAPGRHQSIHIGYHLVVTSFITTLI
jgi:hypothetical protein